MDGRNTSIGPSLPVSVSSTGYWEWNIAAGTVFFSDRLMASIGVYRPDNTLMDSEVLDIVHPADRSIYKETLDAHLAGDTEVFNVEVRVIDDTGNLRWVLNRGVLQRDHTGRHVSMAGSITDITPQRKLEEALRLAATAVSGKIGPAFFRSLTEFLARSLDCDLVLVGRLAPETGVVRTLGAWKDGGAIANFEYLLDVSPCRNVVGREMCVYPEQVWRHFPDDVALATDRFEGYAGAPLFDSQGRGIGLVAVLYRRPIANAELIRDVLSIFAFRAASEIERTEREQELRDSERRFRDFASASADHFWETDAEHRLTSLYGGVSALRDVTVEAMLGSRPWELPDAQPVDDDSWDSHKRVLGEHREFRGFAFRMNSGDDEQKYYSVSGLPVFDERGQFSGYRGTATDITDQILARRSEQEIRERLNLAVDAADLFVWDWDMGAERVDWRTDPVDLLGPRPVSGYPDFRDMVHPEDLEKYLDAFAGSVLEDLPYAVEFRIRRTDGNLRWLSVKGALVRDEKGRPLRFLGITQDMTTRREAEEKLRLAATVFATREPILITDSAGTILDVNEAFLTLFGYQRDAVLGRTPAMLRSGQHDEKFYREFWDQLVGDGYWQGEMLNRASDGRIIPNWMVIDSVYDDTGRVYRYVATCNDISERKQTEERIQRLAWYDPLTRLPNRRSLASKLEKTLRDHDQRAGYRGLLLIDVDDFKTINESLGYQTGDGLLVSLAESIAAESEACDTVARAGSDEFAILLPDLGDDRSQAIGRVQARAEAIMSRLAQPIDARGKKLRVSCSMGIHVFPEDGLDAFSFLARCEMALNQAKLDGHSSARLFHPEMKQRSDERLHVQSLLSSMRERRRLENLYQPQVDTRGRVIGVEALARLRDDDDKLLEPARFIGIAEETGLIFPLGELVLRHALLDMRRWCDNDVFNPGFVAVNVSPRQFLHEDFTAMVLNALDDSGVGGHQLELEITENLLVADFARVVSVMTALRNHGVRFAIDDFGTGYSSLSYLNRLPIDKLKIDRSFIANLDTDGASQVIVSVILSMARAMRLEVVAEGVETAAIQRTLHERGCLAYQGFLFHLPAPASSLAGACSSSGCDEELETIPAPGAFPARD